MSNTAYHNKTIVHVNHPDDDFIEGESIFKKTMPQVDNAMQNEQQEALPKK